MQTTQLQTIVATFNIVSETRPLHAAIPVGIDLL